LIKFLSNILFSSNVRTAIRIFTAYLEEYFYYA
jgi:hypothetical protein